MTGVMRLGGERVCLIVPEGTPTAFLMTLRRNQSTFAHEPGDDAENGMRLYTKGGGVVTWCSQLALFDLQSDELDVDCLACIANQGKVE